MFLAAEADPFIKVGGLGDVAGSLPPALRALKPASGEESLDIRIVLPLYGAIKQKDYPLDHLATVTIGHTLGPQVAEIYQTHLDGLVVYLISGSFIPESGPIYSGDPQIDGRKFIFFSLAALEMTRAIDWQPDVIHANDWHTAAAVYWLGLHRSQDPFFARISTLLGIHNLPYLGSGTADVMGAFGLPPAASSGLPEWARHLPLPLGLFTADRIVTVSPGYAAEILTPEFGSGLDEFLMTRADVVSGILNGIDEAAWDPAIDRDLVENYSLAELARRKTNREALQGELGLPVQAKGPLLSMVTRLVHQKGVDLALDALRLAGDLEWQLILLGTGDDVLEEDARRLQAEYPDRVRAVIRFDPGLSRRIYGGSDAILIPSRYEPSGLTQMIAMRYGCVPIARATGGLRDTIKDYHEEKNGTGFLFSKEDPVEMADTLGRALDVFQNTRRWRGIQRRGMQQDFSWRRSAQAYFNLYQAMVHNKVAGTAESPKT
jgi:starch synthase